MTVNEISRFFTFLSHTFSKLFATSYTKDRSNGILPREKLTFTTL